MMDVTRRGVTVRDIDGERIPAGSVDGTAVALPPTERASRPGEGPMWKFMRSVSASRFTFLGLLVVVGCATEMGTYDTATWAGEKGHERVTNQCSQTHRSGGNCSSSFRCYQANGQGSGFDCEVVECSGSGGTVQLTSGTTKGSGSGGNSETGCLIEV
jgi:hypothetical protein